MPRKKKEETGAESEKSEEETKPARAKKSEDESKKSKLAALKEKAKEFEKSIVETEVKELSIKKKIESDEEKVETLVPIEDYLKSSIHLGTRAITPDMKPFVYKRRADGLAVFNTSLLDEKIRTSAEFLSKYAPEDVIIVCKREAGWKALELFSKATSIRIFTKQYPAGILTNSNLSDFIETKLVFVCDPWIDKNAFNDAKRIRIPILAICDTNNYTAGIAQILPGNNKSAKSLGMIFYLMAKLYTEKKGISAEIPPIKEWIENWDALEPPK